VHEILIQPPIWLRNNPLQAERDDRTDISWGPHETTWTLPAPTRRVITSISIG